MINSLFKDSHITQPSSFPNSRPNSMKTIVGYNLSKGASVNNSIVTKNPAEISFRGVSDIKLAGNSVYKKLVKNARAFIGEKADTESVKKLIGKAIDVVNGTVKEIDIDSKPFFESNKQDIKVIVTTSKELIGKDELKNKKVDCGIVNKKVKEIIEAAMKQLEILEINQTNKNSIYKNKFFKDFLKFADDFQILFGATFALILTCMLRPLTIMALPGDKKNNDDKKYASAHSMSSGLLGFGLALLISAPISTAIKKVLEKPEEGKYIKHNGINYLKDTANARTVSTYLNQVPDILLAVPKAMITIALVPIILKNVFGLQKKSETTKKANNVVSTNVPPNPYIRKSNIVQEGIK